jgi:hypothetical protein
MILPNSSGGATTEQVGYFEIESAAFAEWLSREFESRWKIRHGLVGSLAEAVVALEVSPVLTRYLCVPIGSWTVLLGNGPLGTDVGLLPSRAAREFGCRALRAVVADDSNMYPARILEVFGPAGDSPLAFERSIAAANDGGRWAFETFGTPYPFEEESAYTRRTKASRFTAEMVYDYLRGLGVPLDSPPDWGNALMVERS